MSPAMLYTILAQASLFAMGAAVVAIVVLAVNRPRRWWAYALVKVGTSGIVGTILFVVWGEGQIEPSPRAYWYVSFVIAAAVGMSFVAGDLMKKAGRGTVDTVPTLPEHTRRVRGLEDRMDAEEGRNTNIEEVADDLRHRVDQADNRAHEHGTSRPEEHDR